MTHHTEQGAIPRSQRDPVTNVFRMEAFFAFVDSWLAHNEGERTERSHAIVFFNVENFKHYNQRYGRAAGDVFIQNMSASVVRAFPRGIVGHVLADQFVVLCELKDVEPAVKRVRSDFRTEHKDSSIWLRAGYCVFGPHDTDASIACDRAKIACEELRGRRDAYLREYDSVLKHELQWRRYVLENFDEALEKGWIRAFCQPIVRVATGETCDVEVLTRWIDPHEGVMPQFEIIPVLEEARLIHKLDLAILRDVCKSCRELEDAGKSYIPFSLNLSRLDFELCDIVSEVEAVLDEYGIPRSRCAIELTESALTGNKEFLKDEVDRFREDGFEVWMDDFGSGYSSLNVLKDYSFDLVKIDMAFVRGIEEGTKAAVMLAKVIDMIKELGIKTLVEGVETQEQYEYLRSLGCGRVQGFLFGEPKQLPDSVVGEGNACHPKVEILAKHAFYEEIGRVNLMRPDPHPPLQGQYVPSDVAASIIRRRHGVCEYLNANALFTALLEEAGREFSDGFLEAIDRCIQAGDWHEHVTEAGGRKVVVRVRPISRSAAYEADAVLAVVDEYHRYD